MKNQISKFLEKHSNIAIWWVTYVPPFLIGIALIWLVVTSILTFRESGLNSGLITFYLGSIGVSISLASTSFSYARVCEEQLKKTITSMGEYFFHAAILLISALLINWLLIEIRELSSKQIGERFANMIIGPFLGVVYVSAFIAAVNLTRGIKKMDEFLWSRTRRDLI